MRCAATQNSACLSAVFDGAASQTLVEIMLLDRLLDKCCKPWLLHSVGALLWLGPVPCHPAVSVRRAHKDGSKEATFSSSTEAAPAAYRLQ